MHGRIVYKEGSEENMRNYVKQFITDNSKKRELDEFLQLTGLHSLLFPIYM
jgi:hypothetical protein